MQMAAWECTTLLGLPRACTRLGSSCTQVALGTWPRKAVRNLMASALSTAAPGSSSAAVRCSSGTMCCTRGEFSRPCQPARAARGRKGCIAAWRERLSDSKWGATCPPGSRTPRGWSSWREWELGQGAQGLLFQKGSLLSDATCDSTSEGSVTPAQSHAEPALSQSAPQPRERRRQAGPGICTALVHHGVKPHASSHVSTAVERTEPKKSSTLTSWLVAVGSWALVCPWPVRATTRYTAVSLARQFWAGAWAYCCRLLPT